MNYVIVQTPSGHFEVVESSKVTHGAGHHAPGPYYGRPYLPVEGNPKTIQGDIERLITDKRPSDLNTLKDLINERDNLTAHQIRTNRPTQSFNPFGDGDKVL